jgi:hypothetical protein
LVALAEDLVKIGPVYFVVQNADVGRHIRKWFSVSTGVGFFGWRQVVTGCLRGRECGFVLMDELRWAKEMAEVMPFLGDNEVVAAYWSNW